MPFVPDEPARRFVPDEPAKPDTSLGVGDVLKHGLRVASGGPLGMLGAMMMEQTQKALDSAAYKAGGLATDIAAPYMAPETAAKIGLATNVGVQSIPMIAGGVIGKMAAPAMQDVARSTMQSAAKPTLESLRTGKAARAIETMLQEGISPTKGGVEQLRARIGDLNREITQLIAASPEVVDKGKAASTLYALTDKVAKQANPQADLKAIETAWTNFLAHPLLTGKQTMPVQLAQELKQGTYRALGEKAYGELKGTEIEAQKAIARGLKDQISAAVPQVSQLNARESSLLNALSVAERRALMEANKNPAGLALLAKNPAAWAAFMADRSGPFKAIIARMLYSGAEQIPSTLGKVAGATAGAVSGQDDQPGVLADILKQRP